MVQVLAEAIPGQGVRRTGGDIAGASPLSRRGGPFGPLDLLVARAAGLKTLNVRRPRLRIVNIPASVGSGDDGGADRGKRARGRRGSRSSPRRRRAMRLRSPRRSMTDGVRSADQPSAAAASAAPMRRSRRWPSAARSSRTASRCSRAEPPPIGRIGNTSRHRVAGRAGSGAGGVVDAGASRAGSIVRTRCRGSRSRCHWRARLPPASASPKSSCSKSTARPGCRSPSATCRSRPSPAPMPGWRYPGGCGGLCCGHPGRCLYVAGMIGIPG